MPNYTVSLKILIMCEEFLFLKGETAIKFTKNVSCGGKYLGWVSDKVSGPLRTSELLAMTSLICFQSC